MRPAVAKLAVQDLFISQPLGATQPTSLIDRAALNRYVASTGSYDDAIRLSPSIIDVSPSGLGLGEAPVLSIHGFTDGQYTIIFDAIPLRRQR